MTGLLKGQDQAKQLGSIKSSCAVAHLQRCFHVRLADFKCQEGGGCSLRRESLMTETVWRRCLSLAYVVLHALPRERVKWKLEEEKS